MICSQWQDAVPMQDAVPTCPSSQKRGNIHHSKTVDKNLTKKPMLWIRIRIDLTLLDPGATKLTKTDKNI
jgi:hypothetical protein